MVIKFLVEKINKIARSDRVKENDNFRYLEFVNGYNATKKEV